MDFCEFALADQGKKPAAHHRLLIRHLEAIARGDKNRLMVWMPPGAAKSFYTTVLFPVWLMMNKGTNNGNSEGINIIGASHVSDLAESFSKKIQKMVLETADFTDYSLQTFAVDLWETTNGCEYKTAGVGGSITGRRADVGIIDDPVRGRKDAESPTSRRTTRDWYDGDFLTRMKPNAPIIIIQCMTGDTKVSMADGTFKNLRDIKIGDLVLSRDNDDNAVYKKVLNFKSQGEDDVYELKTGNSTVKANARHPFLVAMDDGTTKWLKLSEIKKGDKIVSSSYHPKFFEPEKKLTEKQAWLLGYMFGDGWITVRDTTQKGYKGRTYPRRGYVTCVAMSAYEAENNKVLGLFEEIFNVRPKETKFGYARTDIADIGRWFTEMGLIGKAKTKRLPRYLFNQDENIKLAFLSGYNMADGAVFSTGASKGRWTHGSCNGDLISDIRHLARGVGYKVSNMSCYRARIKAPNSKDFVDSENWNVQWNPERINSDFYDATVRSITYVGKEEVFDLQIEDTECFIADGLVSHNTRWHEDDLSGSLLQTEGDDWEVLSLPAMAGVWNDSTKQWEEGPEPDPLGRKPGEFLWADDEYGYANDIQNKMERAGPRDYWSLYQQSPRPLTGGIFKTSNINIIDALPAGNMQAVRGWDLAGTKESGTTDPDFTAGALMFKDREGRYFIANIQRERGGPDEVEKLILATASQDSRLIPVSLPQDPGQAGKAQVLYLTRKLGGYRVHTSTESGDKATRAAPMAAQVNVGNVYLIRGDWNKDFIDELKSFPNGKHDDMVDAASRAFNYLTGAVATDRFEALAS